jgi:hypothetical protein
MHSRTDMESFVLSGERDESVTGGRGGGVVLTIEGPIGCYGRTALVHAALAWLSGEA